MFFSLCPVGLQLLSAHCSHSGWQNRQMCQWERRCCRMSGLGWQLKALANPVGLEHGPTHTPHTKESGCSLTVCLHSGRPRSQHKQHWWPPHWPTFKIRGFSNKTLGFQFLLKKLEALAILDPCFYLETYRSWVSGNLGNLSKEHVLTLQWLIYVICLVDVDQEFVIISIEPSRMHRVFTLGGLLIWISWQPSKVMQILLLFFW